MDLIKYENRLGAISTAQAFIEDTITLVNNEFENTPSYKTIKINGIDDDCVVKLTNVSTKLDLILRPRKIITKGMHISLDNKDYLVTEFTQNEIYPKAEIELCNNTLRWRDTLGVLKEYQCILQGDSVQLKNSTTNEYSRIIILSDAQTVIKAQYNDDTKSITANQRFVFGENTFEVIKIDNFSDVYKGKGLIKLTIQSTSKSDTDDTNTGVADDSGNSDWSGW